MVVSIICSALILTGLLFIAFMFFLRINREEIFMKVIQLICACGFVIIGAVRLKMDIAMNESCAISIAIIIISIVIVAISSTQLWLQLKKDKQ